MGKVEGILCWKFNELSYSETQVRQPDVRPPAGLAVSAQGPTFGSLGPDAAPQAQPDPRWAGQGRGRLGCDDEWKGNLGLNGMSTSAQGEERSIRRQKKNQNHIG